MVSKRRVRRAHRQFVRDDRDDPLDVKQGKNARHLGRMRLLRFYRRDSDG